MRFSALYAPSICVLALLSAITSPAADERNKILQILIHQPSREKRDITKQRAITRGKIRPQQWLYMYIASVVLWYKTAVMQYAANDATLQLTTTIKIRGTSINREIVSIKNFL